MQKLVFSAVEGAANEPSSASSASNCITLEPFSAFTALETFVLNNALWPSYPCKSLQKIVVSSSLQRKCSKLTNFPLVCTFSAFLPALHSLKENSWSLSHVHCQVPYIHIQPYWAWSLGTCDEVMMRFLYTEPPWCIIAIIEVLLSQDSNEWEIWSWPLAAVKSPWTQLWQS